MIPRAKRHLKRTRRTRDNRNPLECGRCESPLLPYYLNTTDGIACVRCGSTNTTTIFPAILSQNTGDPAGKTTAAETESSCFYHPDKRAATICETCGRFICDLCEIVLGGRRLCPACVDAGQKKGKIRNLERQRTLYDEVALALAVYPLILWPLTLFTAPATLYIVIRYWKAPLSVIPRTRIRFVLAALLAGLQVTGWAIAIPSIFL